jgi:hypothetical protein
MGAVMIRCPQTGHAIPTGYEADPARFRETPVFFAITYCPICRADHQWFAGDAWVREASADAKPWRDAGRPAPVWPGTQGVALGDRDGGAAAEDGGTR